MPDWKPPELQDRRTTAEESRPSVRAGGFETSLPGELALHNMGIASESSQGLKSYPAGSIFETGLAEPVILTGLVVVNPFQGSSFIDRVAIDLASGRAQNLALLQAEPYLGLVYFPPQASESSQALDASDPADAAQQASTAVALDPGQESPQGGEITPAAPGPDPYGEAQQSYTPAVTDGVEEQQTYTTQPSQDISSEAYS